MGDELTRRLLEEIKEMREDIKHSNETNQRNSTTLAIIQTQLQEREKVEKDQDHESRIKALEEDRSSFIGAKWVVVFIVTSLLPTIFTAISWVKGAGK